MIIRALFAALAAAVTFLGIHLVLLVATVIIAAAVVFLLYCIASVLADCGGRIMPCRRRFAW